MNLMKNNRRTTAFALALAFLLAYSALLLLVPGLIPGPSVLDNSGNGLSQGARVQEYILHDQEEFMVGRDGAAVGKITLTGSSYLSTEDPRLHFGLGTASTADLTVHWPEGTQTQLVDVKANQHLTVAADTDGSAPKR